jgi:hypothetical protein
MKRLFLTLSALFILLGLSLWLIKEPNQPTPFPKHTEQNRPLPQPKNQPPKTTPQPTPLPSSFDLPVEFVPQAPFGVWDELHNNACEEASLVLVHYYKKGLTLTKEKMEKEIQALVQWQIKKYGQHKDLTLKEVAEMAQEFYGYQEVKVINDFDWPKLKREIVQNNPVIIPAAGRLLQNPYFRQPGPIYHMLVIRGYNEKEVITNDVGTKRGEGYRYSYQTLDRAIHDWTGRPETITQGRRAMLVIIK